MRDMDQSRLYVLHADRIYDKRMDAARYGKPQRLGVRRGVSPVFVAAAGKYCIVRGVRRHAPVIEARHIPVRAALYGYGMRENVRPDA